MAGQGWTAQVAAAAGTAAAAGAAQLGLGYGLGVVVWQQAVADDAVWSTSLTWATWIAATSTILGAIAGGRVGRPTAVPGFALAAPAAIGALLTVALIAVPARAAVRADTFAPQTVAAGYAVVGVLIGLVLASWAANSPPIAANLLATTASIWLLAVVAVVADLLGSRTGPARLGVWHPFPTGWFLGNLAWPGAVLVLVAAFLIGFAVSRTAVRRGDAEFGATVAGVMGPLVVALAYLVLAPRLTGLRDTQISAYLVAPYGVLAGLAGSVLAVAAGRTARTGMRRTSEFREARPVRIRTSDPAPTPPSGQGASDGAGRTPTSTAAGPVAKESAPAPRKSTVKRPPARPRVAELLPGRDAGAPPVDPWADTAATGTAAGGIATGTAAAPGSRVDPGVQDEPTTPPGGNGATASSGESAPRSRSTSGSGSRSGGRSVPGSDSGGGDAVVTGSTATPVGPGAGRKRATKAATTKGGATRNTATAADPTAVAEPKGDQPTDGTADDPQKPPSLAPLWVDDEPGATPQPDGRRNPFRRSRPNGG